MFKLRGSVQAVRSWQSKDQKTMFSVDVICPGIVVPVVVSKAVEVGAEVEVEITLFRGFKGNLDAKARIVGRF